MPSFIFDYLHVNVSRECLSVCVFVCTCAYLPVQTCVCVFVSVS